MAGRPKRGIEYAAWDVDIFENDTKIDELLDAQGWTGFAIYFYLCQRAYASEGYFYRWSYANAATTARRMGGGIGSETVRQAVGVCLQIGLFDKRLFDLGGVLTSRGIQRRYAMAIQGRRIKTVNTEFWLLDNEESKGFGIVRENGDSLPANDDLQAANGDLQTANAPKSKVKESKVKESKGKESNKAAKPREDYLQMTADKIAERGFSFDVDAILKEFVLYKKKEKKFQYQDIGFKNLLDKVQENIEQYGEPMVISLIKETMSNGWQGIIWENLVKQAAQRRPQDRIANRVSEVDNWLK